MWKHDILPLLEEHYCGRLTRDQLRDRFGLAALRAILSGDEDADVVAAEPSVGDSTGTDGSEV